MNDYINNSQIFRNQQTNVNNRGGTILVPSVPLRTETGDIRIADLYSLLLDERTILFSDDFNPASCKKLAASIMYLNQRNGEKPITIMINSPGGSVYSLLTVLETMQHCTCKIRTYLMGGLAASCAAMLFICGDERYMSPLSNLMFHQVSSQAKGTIADMNRAFSNAQRLQDWLFKVILKRSTNGKIKTMEDVAKLCDRDNFLNLKEAYEYGFVDYALDAKNNGRAWMHEAHKECGLLPDNIPSGSMSKT